MAKTVNDSFNEFNANTVNLISDKTNTARSSRDWLMKQLESLPEKADNFPLLYTEKSIKYGSFARNTKIRPLDDIDLILGLHANKAWYRENRFGIDYTVYINDNTSRLWQFRNVDGSINSIKIVNKLVSALNEVSHYEKAEIHRCQEAATLKLNSYEWNFDIVPAFYTTADFYLIPDGGGGWKATDPRIDQNRISTINQKHNGKILQLIRTLKYWNNRPNMPTIPSYLFENIILNFFDNQSGISDWIDYNLRNFWQHLQNAIYQPVLDPKGFQTDLNEIEWDKRIRISAKAKETYEKASEAYKLEMHVKNQEAAINKWKEIFGDEFPKYE